MGKPVGRDPVEYDGIILRWSSEIPEGMQALYDEASGQVLWVGLIGTSPGPEIKATAITVSREQYHAINEAKMRSKLRKLNRSFRMN